MKKLAVFALALSALAAEAPKPSPAAKEIASDIASMSKRIVELERQNAISETRALRAKWEHFASEAQRLDGEWKTAALKACSLHGIQPNECQWQNDTIARLQPAPTPAAKATPTAKGQ